jgi:hypothetical protein
MPRSSKILIVAGLALAIWGMSYGFYYAVFAEHQTLDTMGSSMEAGFESAARKDLPQAAARIDNYARAEFVYTRQVDAHSHWIGLAMLLFILGMAFDRVNFAEATRRLLAWSLVAGSVFFPLGVLWETSSHGRAPEALAILGAAVVISALALVAIGFARSPGHLSPN